MCIKEPLCVMGLWLLQAVPIPICMGFHGLFVLFQKQADKQPRNPASPALTKKKQNKKNAPGPRCILVLHLPFHLFALWWLQPQFGHKAHSQKILSKTSMKSYTAKNHNTKKCTCCSKCTVMSGIWKMWKLLVESRISRMIEDSKNYNV